MKIKKRMINKRIRKEIKKMIRKKKTLVSLYRINKTYKMDLVKIQILQNKIINNYKVWLCLLWMKLKSLK
jgi:hypothetical protein